MKAGFDKLLLFVFLVIYFFAFAFAPDKPTYLLETSPAIFGILILLIFYKKFKFSNAVYSALFFGACLLVIGGYYTYAQVPVFDYFFHNWELRRNYYDRFGHFFQGFISALVVNEIILRKKILKDAFWTGFFIVCVSLALSAAYELFEVSVCFLYPDRADVYLSIQSDIFDSQFDMVCAIAGSIFFVVLAKKQLDKYLQKIFK